MNSRELSEKLDALATRLESEPDDYIEIVKELRILSNKKYAPGNNLSWDAVKLKNDKKAFVDKSGRKLPF